MDIDLARAWILTTATAIEDNKERLTRLDSAIGDADHGSNMQRGFAAVRQALEGYAATGVGDVFIKTGTTLISRVGGAAGPLYGSAFRGAGKQLSGVQASVDEVGAALAAALAEIRTMGAAQLGDKTMVDAFSPAVDAFRAAAADGGDLAFAARVAADAAEEGLQASGPLQARRGRASYLGERSIGHQDPGAASTALVFRALAETAKGRLSE